MTDPAEDPRADTAPLTDKVPSAGPPPARPKRRRFRKFLRVTCIPALLLAAALVLVATMPFSCRYLDRKVSEAWLRETGLDLVFENATYYLAQERLEVHGVVISDHESSERLLEVGRVEVRWDWHIRRPTTIDLASVEIVEPAVMSVSAQKTGGLRADARLHALIQLFERLAERTRKETATEPGSAPPAAGKVRHPTITVGVADASLAVATGGHRFELGSTNVSFLYHDEQRWRMTVTGRLAWADGQSAFLSARLAPGRPAPGGQPRVAMTLRCGEVDLRDLLPLPQGLGLACASLSADGTFGWEGRRERLAGNLALHGDRVAATLPNGETLVPPFPLAATLDAAIDPAHAALEIRSLALDGLGSKASARGRLGLTDNEPYDCELSGARLTCDALNVFLAGLLPETAGRTTFWNGTMTASARMTGDRRGPDWRASSGALRLAGLEMTLQHERRNLGPLDVDAAWSSGTLRLGRGDLRVGQSTLSARGEVAGLLDGLLAPTGAATTATAAAAPPPRVRANWDVALQAEDLLECLPPESLPGLRRWEPRGTLTGRGAVEGAWAPTSATEATPGARLLEQARSALQALKIDGALVLADASVNHPILPGPLRNVAGTVHVSNGALECKNLTGEMLKSSIAITAGVTGKTVFWNTPRLTVKTKGKLDLEHLPEVLDSEGLRGNGWMTERKRAMFEQLLPQGELEFDLQAEGPLLQPARATVLGDVRLSNLACRLDNDWVHGDGTLRTGRVRFARDRVLIENWRGALDAVDWATSGTLGTRHSELRLTVNTTEEALRDAAPWLFEYWTEVGGSARLAMRWTADLRHDGPMQPPASPTALVFAAVDRRAARPGATPLSAAWFHDRFAWDFSATLDAQNLVYSHAYLPGIVREISGRIEANRHRVATDGYLRCSWGDSRDGVASASLTVAHVTPPRGRAAAAPDLWDVEEGKTFPALRFDGHFPTIYLDEWIKTWGPSRIRPPADRPASAAAPSEFEPERKDTDPKRLFIQGRLGGDIVYVGKYEFQNAACLLSDRVYPNRTAFLELEDLRGDLYDGHMTGYVSFLLPHRRLTSWVWDADATEIDTDKLLAAAFGGKATLSGHLTGRMHLTGVEDFTPTYLGSGEFHLRDSRFMGNPLFAGLGRLLGSQDLENISFTQMNGAFHIANDRVAFPDLRLNGPLMDLAAHGTAGFDKTLDLMAVYRFFSFTDRVPVLATAARMVSALGGHFLKVHMVGTFQKPEMQPVPLLMDELTGLWPTHHETAPTSGTAAPTSATVPTR